MYNKALILKVRVEEEMPMKTGQRYGITRSLFFNHLQGTVDHKICIQYKTTADAVT